MTIIQEKIIGNATLLLGDCMEYMSDMEDNAFDLAIVDPPFGVGDFLMKTSGGTTKNGKTRQQRTTLRKYKKDNCKWNNKIPSNKYFIELKRVSKNQIIWGANYFNCFSEKGGSLVWYKNIGHKNLSDCEIASVSFQKKNDFIYIQNLNGFCVTEPRIHPCQKPLELYSYILNNYAKPGQSILDTHLGSASSAIASNRLGFEFTGIEIDQDYFEGGCERVRQEDKQLNLFKPEVFTQTNFNLDPS